MLSLFSHLGRDVVRGGWGIGLGDPMVAPRRVIALSGRTGCQDAPQPHRSEQPRSVGIANGRRQARCTASQGFWRFR
jgi:hypothetical protein